MSAWLSRSRLMRALRMFDMSDVSIRLGSALYDERTDDWKGKWDVRSGALVHTVDTVEEAQELRRALRVLVGRDPETGEPR